MYVAQNFKNIYSWGLLITLAIVWGSSFILMKRGLVVFDHLELAQLRMAIAWLSLLPFVWRHLFSIDKKHLLPIIIVSLFGNGIPAFLFSKAQTQIDSSFAGILNALVPIFTFVIGVLIFKNSVKKIQVFGIITGLIGAVSLMTYGGLVMQNSHYSWYVIGATLCYAISLNTIKYALQELSALKIAGLAFFVVGPLCLAGLAFSDFLEKMQKNDGGPEALFYIFLLSTLATSIALVLFNQLVKQTSAIFASSVTYLIPVVAIFWGVVDGEPITFWHFLSMAVIIVGILLVNKSKID